MIKIIVCTALVAILCIAIFSIMQNDTARYIDPVEKIQHYIKYEHGPEYNLENRLKECGEYPHFEQYKSCIEVVWTEYNLTWDQIIYEKCGEETDDADTFKSCIFIMEMWSLDHKNRPANIPEVLDIRNNDTVHVKFTNESDAPTFAIQYT